VSGLVQALGLAKNPVVEAQISEYRHTDMHGPLGAGQGEGQKQKTRCPKMGSALDKIKECGDRRVRS
jgi:hypothetical protein